MYGIRGKTLDLLIDYFRNRKQFTEIDSRRSSNTSIEWGVIQGGVLAALLFVLYVNDIGILKLNGQVFTFADDTAIVYENYDNNTMQEDLNVLSDFFRINVLSINATKTKYMIMKSIHNRNVPDNPPPLYMNDVQLQRVADIRYLGLHIDQCLTWTKHIEILCKEISRPTGILFKLRHRLNKNILTKIYHSLIQSKFTYMINIWTSAKEKYKKKIYVLQNRALKIINKLPALFPTDTLYSQVMPRILPIKRMTIKTLVTFVQQCKYNLIHHTTVFESVTYRNTRTANNRNLIIPPARTQRYGKESIKYRAVMSYNGIPLETKLLDNIVKFKSEVTKWILDNTPH